MDRTAEVIIIGAGSSGGAAAYYLAEHGLKDILILDKQGPGAGATGRAGGLIRHHYPDRRIVEMVRYCTERFRHFEEEIGSPIDYINSGFLYLTADHAKDTHALAAMQRDAGVRVEVLTPEEVAKIHPLGEIRTDGIGDSLLDHDAAHADPYKVAAGYCNRAKDMGVRIKLGVEVLDAKTQNGRITELITDKGRYSAGLVINAAGLGAASINDRLGIRLPLLNFPMDNAVLIPDIPYDPHMLTINDGSSAENTFYIRSDSGGSVLMGFTLDASDYDQDPNSYYFNASFERKAAFSQYVIHRMPFLANFRITTTFGALDVRTPDWNPGIGILEHGPENYFQIIGGSGHCFKLAPVIGLGAAEMILNEPQTFNMDLFDINRLTAFNNKDFENSGSFFIYE